MRIAYTGARLLGAKCLAWLWTQPGITIVAAHASVPHNRAWWTDVKDHDLIRGMGLPSVHPSEFASLNPDLVVSVLNSYIFKPHDLDAYPSVNLHPAPLPEYRGCNGYAHAIQNGDATYRVTLHYVDEGIDTGPIIEDDTIPIHDDDTGRTLYDRAQIAAFELFTWAMPAVIDAHHNGNRAAHRPQDESRAGYTPRTSLDDKRTNPEDNQRIRALHFPPFPPADLTTAVPIGHGR